MESTTSLSVKATTEEVQCLSCFSTSAFVSYKIHKVQKQKYGSRGARARNLRITFTSQLFGFNSQYNFLFYLFWATWKNVAGTHFSVRTCPNNKMNRAWPELERHFVMSPNRHDHAWLARPIFKYFKWKQFLLSLGRLSLPLFLLILSHQNPSVWISLLIFTGTGREVFQFIISESKL